MGPGIPVYFDLEPDRWLASVIGRPAYTVKAAASAGSDPATIVGRLQREGGFASAKLPATTVAQANRLVDAGFRVVDMALRFARQAGKGAAVPATRDAVPEDELRVREIAGIAFTCSRFHLDPRFPKDLANRIKAEWAGNYFRRQRGDAMLVAEADGVVAGFCQLILKDGRTIIDLIAVDPAFSRRGLARQLVNGVVACAARKGVAASSVVVGTQAANTASVNLYESCGFRLSGSTLVLHASAT